MEAEKIAELAPDVKTKREAQEVIKTIEDNEETIQEQEQLTHENNINKPYNRFIHTNIQLITNELDIATESMKIFNEFVCRLTKFNMSALRTWWFPFLYFAQLKG
jgi:HD superfamily phosphohydrolase